MAFCAVGRYRHARGALRIEAKLAREVRSTTTVSGLPVGSVVDGDSHEVVAACRRFDANGYVVTDERVSRWQARLARADGIFYKPAGAVALAGLERGAQWGELRANEQVVCIATGSCFRDERAVMRLADASAVEFLGNFS